MRKLFYHFVLGLGLSWQASSLATDTNQSAIFKHFLEKPPKIRLVRYSISGELNQVNGKPFPGMVYYEGAWQENTFYVRGYSEHEGQPPGFPMAGDIGGKSVQEYWYWDNQVPGSVLSVERDTEGFDKAGPAQTMTYQRVHIFEEMLQSLRAMGLNLTTPGTARWLDEKHFVAESDRLGAVHGEIVGLTNGYVERIECNYDGPPARHIAISYTYDTYDFGSPFSGLPNSFTFWAPNGNGWLRAGEVDIQELQLGDDPSLPPEGYLPGAFMTKLIKTNATAASKQGNFPALVLYSNGNSYEVKGNEMYPIGAYDPKALQKVMKTQKRWWIWGIFIIINAFLVLWLYTRKGARKP